LQGACSSPLLQYLRDYGVLTLLNHNQWKFLSHSQFYVFHWDSSSLPYRFVILPRPSCFLTCHNDVIDAGYNNRLFAPALIQIGNVFVYHMPKRYILRTNMWSIFLSTDDIVNKDKDRIKRDTLIWGEINLLINRWHCKQRKGQNKEECFNIRGINRCRYLTSDKQVRVYL
jgi:hypothetical protein